VTLYRLLKAGFSGFGASRQKLKAFHDVYQFAVDATPKALLRHPSTVFDPAMDLSDEYVRLVTFRPLAEISAGNSTICLHSPPLEMMTGAA